MYKFPVRCWGSRDWWKVVFNASLTRSYALLAVGDLMRMRASFREIQFSRCLTLAFTAERIAFLLLRVRGTHQAKAGSSAQP
jgi:hypothetical protein